LPPPPPTPEKYSALSTNYLPMDFTTATPSEIQSAISTAAGEIKNSSSPLPYAFNVVDANNNPIDFPIFATAIGLKLPSSTLGLLGDNFLLYLYKDNDNTRLSLSVSLKGSPTDVSAQILKTEKTLIDDSTPLFLNTAPEIKGTVFNNGSYKNNVIRYFNLNKGETLSLDYVIIGDQLVISTSKNTTHAVIDKLLANKTSALPQTSTENTEKTPDTSANSPVDTSQTN
jgi:hypothetical protein